MFSCCRKPKNKPKKKSEQYSLDFDINPKYKLDEESIEAIEGLESTKDLVSGGLTGLYNLDTGEILARAYQSSGKKTGEIYADHNGKERQKAVLGEGSAHEVMANDFFEPVYDVHGSFDRFLDANKGMNPWPAVVNFENLRGWSISRLESPHYPLMNGENLVVRFGSNSLNLERQGTIKRFMGPEDRLTIMNALAQAGFKNIMYYTAVVEEMGVTPDERAVINEISSLCPFNLGAGCILF